MINSESELLLIKKPWGFEFEFFDNTNISIWVVCIGQEHKSGYLLENHSTSYHMHTTKEALVLPLLGCVKVTTPLQTTIIQPGQFTTLRPRTPHRLSPYLGFSILFEIEIPSNRNDIIRLADTYGRTNNTYSWDLDNEPEALRWKSELRSSIEVFDLDVSGPSHQRTLTLENRISVTNKSFKKGDIVDVSDDAIFIITQGSARTEQVNKLDLPGDIISGKLLKTMLLNPDSDYQLYSPTIQAFHIDGVKHQSP